MTQRNPKALQRITAGLDALLGALPTPEEQASLEAALANSARILQELHERVRHLPSVDERQKLAESLEIIKSFVLKAQSNPRLAASLGLDAGRASPRQAAQIASHPARDLRAVVEQLDVLPTSEIETQLLDGARYDDETLRQLARALNLRVGRGAGRKELVDKIVKLGFANRRGYALLGVQKKDLERK